MGNRAGVGQFASHELTGWPRLPLAHLIVSAGVWHGAFQYCSNSSSILATNIWKPAISWTVRYSPTGHGEARCPWRQDGVDRAVDDVKLHQRGGSDAVEDQQQAVAGALMAATRRSSMIRAVARRREQLPGAGAGFAVLAHADLHLVVG